ncbi:MAG: FliI/YscN family ATPase [Pseudomonadota bacterium]
MDLPDIEALGSTISSLQTVKTVGRVTGVTGNTVLVSGLRNKARLGDRVKLASAETEDVFGEIIRLSTDVATVLAESDLTGVSINDRVLLLPPQDLYPCDAWLGRLVDPFGQPMDGRGLRQGLARRSLFAAPPPVGRRRSLGKRLETGTCIFDTMLPIVRGQRLGLFAGSGVGKSTLLGELGKKIEADVVILALIGERGREVRDFVEQVLGEEGMKRAVIVAATSEQSPLVRRRCAWAAMSVAEYFRDAGQHVLLLADSITRFAEAHREISVAAGELPVLRGFPGTTSQTITALAERAGPGADVQGDITALFSVLVAGSDMDEPVADILRGVLDGHVTLDREIAERGRFPAIDILRSVSRSLPRAATDQENVMIRQARALLGRYAHSETMIQAGLYTQGSDPDLDKAIAGWPELDAFVSEMSTSSIDSSFSRLSLILRRAGIDQGNTVRNADRRNSSPIVTKPSDRSPEGKELHDPVDTNLSITEDRILSGTDTRLDS